MNREDSHHNKINENITKQIIEVYDDDVIEEENIFVIGNNHKNNKFYGKENDGRNRENIGSEN